MLNSRYLRIFKIFIFTTFGLVIPILVLYNLYKRQRFARKIEEDENIVLCDCCCEYRKESIITEYIYKDNKYQVCEKGMSMDNKELYNMFENSKIIKFLIP